MSLDRIVAATDTLTVSPSPYNYHVRMWQQLIAPNECGFISDSTAFPTLGFFLPTNARRCAPNALGCYNRQGYRWHDGDILALRRWLYSRALSNTLRGHLERSGL